MSLSLMARSQIPLSTPTILSTVDGASFSALPLTKACNSLCVMEPICRAAYSGSTCVFHVISSVRMVFGLRIGRRESIHSA